MIRASRTAGICIDQSKLLSKWISGSEWIVSWLSSVKDEIVVRFPSAVHWPTELNGIVFIIFSCQCHLQGFGALFRLLCPLSKYCELSCRSIARFYWRTRDAMFQYVRSTDHLRRRMTGMMYVVMRMSSFSTIFFCRHGQINDVWLS